jgi:hypothetical protein
VGGSICLSTDATRGLVAGNGVRAVVLAASGLASLGAFLIPFPLARVCLPLTLIVLVVANFFLLSRVLLALSLLGLTTLLGLAFLTAAFLTTGFLLGFLVALVTLRFDDDLVLAARLFLADFALASLAELALEDFLVALAGLALAFDLSLDLAFFARAAISVLPVN